MGCIRRKQARNPGTVSCISGWTSDKHRCDARRDYDSLLKTRLNISASCSTCFYHGYSYFHKLFATMNCGAKRRRTEKTVRAAPNTPYIPVLGHYLTLSSLLFTLYHSPHYRANLPPAPIRRIGLCFLLAHAVCQTPQLYPGEAQ